MHRFINIISTFVSTWILTAPNSIYEVDTIDDPPGLGNPYNSSYRPQYSLIKSEAEAGRDTNPATGRSWFVVNPSQHNSVGQPTGYRIVPGADVARPFAHKVQVCYGARDLFAIRYGSPLTSQLSATRQAITSTKILSPMGWHDG
jgi:Cu2+-containing amine oxidase